MTEHTRPGEIARIKALADNDPRWEDVLTKLAVLVERSEESKAWQRTTDKWRIDHDLSDTKIHAEFRTEIDALQSGIGGVRSGVNDYKEDKLEFNGARKLFVGTVAVIGAIGAVMLSLKGLKEAAALIVDWFKT